MGALEKLHSTGELGSVCILVGTSVGAVLCFLLAIGYAPRDILREMIQDRVLEKTIDALGPQTDGFVDPSIFRAFIERCANKTPYGADITFGQLSRKLYVNTFDTVSWSELVFGPDTHPDQNVIDAVMASSAVPLLLPPVSIDGGSAVCVDGGLACNFKTELAADILIREPGEPRHKRLIGVSVPIDRRGAGGGTWVSSMYALLSVPMMILSEESERRARAKLSRAGISSITIHKLYGAHASLPIDPRIMNTSSLLREYTEGYNAVLVSKRKLKQE